MTVARDRLWAIQGGLREVRDQLLGDPLNEHLWRRRRDLLNEEIGARHEITAEETLTPAPEYGERRGDYIWMSGDLYEEPALTLDYWHYQPELKP